MPFITEALFESLKPILNPRNKDSEQFETYGEDLDFVTKRNTDKPGTVWTVIETDETLEIHNGMHLVDRLYFIVTEEPGDTDMKVLLVDFDEIED